MKNNLETVPDLFTWGTVATKNADQGQQTHAV